MSFQKITFYLTLTIIVALVVRVMGVLNWGNFLFDEMVSVAIAKLPRGQMWEYLRFEMHPPLHFYYLHYWIKLFGDSEITSRLSSTLISLISIPIVYLLGRDLFGSKSAGLGASLLVAISSYQSFQAIWARMYSLTFLLTTLSFYFFLKAINYSGHTSRIKIYWLLYWLTTLLALYTHLTALIIIFIQLIFLVYLRY